MLIIIALGFLGSFAIGAIFGAVVSGLEPLPRWSGRHFADPPAGVRVCSRRLYDWQEDEVA